MNIKFALTGLALTSTLALSTIAPAKADGAASTRNLILGAAALVAGVAIEQNVARKNAQAGSVQGYLPDGSTVYQDGHVVAPNGQSYYPGNDGQQVSCNVQSCWLSNDGSQAAYTQGQYGRARADRGYSAGARYNQGSNRIGWRGNH